MTSWLCLHAAQEDGGWSRAVEAACLCDSTRTETSWDGQVAWADYGKRK
jgi:hypothetical protein